MLYLIQKLTTEHLKGMVEMTLKNWMINEMEMQVSDMIGQEIYGCDLGYQLFDNANCDGSYTYNRYDAEMWIEDYFSDIGDVAQDIVDNLGAESLANPFLEPEKFMVQIMLESSSAIIAQCPIIDENWNNSLKLTEETIKQIIKELREQKD